MQRSCQEERRSVALSFVRWDEWALGHKLVADANVSVSQSTILLVLWVSPHRGKVVDTSQAATISMPGEAIAQTESFH